MREADFITDLSDHVFSIEGMALNNQSFDLDFSIIHVFTVRMYCR